MNRSGAYTCAPRRRTLLQLPCVHESENSKWTKSTRCLHVILGEDVQYKKAAAWDHTRIWSSQRPSNQLFRKYCPYISQSEGGSHFYSSVPRHVSVMTSRVRVKTWCFATGKCTDRLTLQQWYERGTDRSISRRGCNAPHH